MNKIIDDKKVFKYKILVVNNDSSIINFLFSNFENSNYNFINIEYPLDSLEFIRNNSLGLIIINENTISINCKDFINHIRKINKSVFILLIGNKDYTYSNDAIKSMDIQGYWEPNSTLDTLSLLIDSLINSNFKIRFIKQINNKVFKKYNKLEQINLKDSSIMQYTLDSQDKYTKSHSKRVSEYAVLLGKKLNLSNEDLITLKFGGLFHDIGKLGISNNILFKKSKLNDEEYLQIKKHPNIGSNILSESSIFNDVLPIIKHHHERFDGKGYPLNLSKNEIPYLARIVSVVDTFDAINSKRSYKSSIPIEEAKLELIKNSGTQFDPEITNNFIDILTNNSNKILEIQKKY